MALKKAGIYAPDGSLYITLTDGAGNVVSTGSGGITISTTTITSGTDTRVLFQDGATVGEDAGLTFTKATGVLTSTQVNATYLGLLAGASQTFYMQASVNGALIMHDGVGSSLNSLGFGTDLFLVHDAANTLALRNGTNGQSFRVYDTYTDGSNYRRAVLAGGLFLEAVGSGAVGAGMYVYNRDVGPIYFGTNNSSRWTIDANGHFIAGTDNLYDIGANLATRPRTGYFGTGLAVGGGITVQTGFGVGVAAGDLYYWAGRSIISSPADGVVQLTDSTQTSFSRLQFGGVTSSFGAIARDGAGIKIVGGDGTSVSWLKIPGVTVASLPAAATAGAGARSFVTDASTTLILGLGGTVAGGGANKVPVYSDGTNWIYG